MPNQQTIGPGQQAVFQMDYDPRTVNVNNTSSFDGQFTYVWLYPSAKSVTPRVSPIASQANVTLQPPGPDELGNRPRTLVIYNTAGATLQCTERQV